MALAVLSVALPPPPPPPAFEVAGLLALARDVIAREEAFGETPAARLPDLARDQDALARVRFCRYLLAALRQASTQTPGLLDDALTADLADLFDRADEMVDTLLWATERRDLLAEIIRAETS